MSEHPEAVIHGWFKGDLRISVWWTGHFPNEKSMTCILGKEKPGWFMTPSTYNVDPAKL